MRPIQAQLHLDHLAHNYRCIQQHAGDASIMAVIKANAYGHGLSLIAPALYALGCRSFAVTDANEGVALRALLHDKACTITLLSGIFDANDAQLCLQHHLTPIITEYWHVQLLQQAGFQQHACLKVDTGMQRFGADEPLTLYQQAQQANINITGIMSHLACADTPEHPLNRAQSDAFAHICASLNEAHGIALPASLLNSAGLIALPDQTLHIVRPGIALYGAEPVSAEPLGLLPVMEMTAQVMQIRHIKQGSPVSYGASFTAPRDMQIALVSAGYADGIPRELSNQGRVSYQGTLLPIIGRVCMDYCLVDCSNSTLQCGESVTFWGSNNLRAETVAKHINTIPYTLMTGISSRVQRISHSPAPS